MPRTICTNSGNYSWMELDTVSSIHQSEYATSPGWNWTQYHVFMETSGFSVELLFSHCLLVNLIVMKSKDKIVSFAASGKY